MGPAGPRVAALVPDLMAASRIESAVLSSGGTFVRLETVAELPATDAVDLLIVDWGDRRPGWDAALVGWRETADAAIRPRVVLFGPHTDLAAHAAARAAGLGPMKARSALFTSLPEILGR